MWNEPTQERLNKIPTQILRFKQAIILHVERFTPLEKAGRIIPGKPTTRLSITPTFQMYFWYILWNNKMQKFFFILFHDKT